MPWAVTSLGSCAVANATRFCTLTAAISGSVPISNVTDRLYDPESELVDDMYIMSSTPLTCASIGAPTVASITSAVAPE